MKAKVFVDLMSLGTRPRLHGNGMIQWYIGRNSRLHYWPGMALQLPDHNAMIHDHTFDMNSTILYGTLNHQVFEFLRRDDDALNQWDLIQFEPDTRKSAKGSVVWQGEKVMKHAVNVTTTYWQAAGTFHLSNPIGHVTSLIHKMPVLDRLARIACPRGETPTDAFDPANAPSTETLLEMMREAPIEQSEYLVEAAINNAKEQHLDRSNL